jgi:single-stranded DNA-specific DHH superfamily exonuclease
VYADITAKMISWNINPVLNSLGRMARGMLSAKLVMTKMNFRQKIYMVT